MRLPDFIIGGAPRSGTTWLYHLLDRHPDVCMAKPLKPEPKFFLVDEIYARGLEYYSRTWFSEAGVGVAAGEKSANYLESAQAAERMHRDVPGVKLIFLLRDPVERAYSNYLWSRMNGMESTDFATALALEEERERTVPVALRFARPHAHLSRGLYARLLEPYFERFPREQILCLRFEDLSATPEALAEQVHRFLGVPARPEDARELGVVNAAQRQDGEAMSPALRAELRWRYAEPNRELARLLGPDFKIWGA